jgi:hypothetical protein
MPSRRNVLIAGASVAAIGAFGYRAWPRLDDYSEAMARLRAPLPADPGMTDLIRYATLAANGHNTQPWKFRTSPDAVSILPDFTRRTPVVDPDDHHLFVSLGCAAENLLIAARAHGRAGAAHIESVPETRIDIDLTRATPSETPLYAAIPRRQSTRTVFDGRPVSEQDLKALETAARQDGVSLRIFTAKTELEDVLDYVVQGNSAQMADPAFVAELRRWIRFSPEQALSTNDGLFGPCSGNPVVPAWIGERAFGLVFKEAAENDKYHDHIRSSAGIAVFVGDRADPEHWIKVGRSFQRFALQATALGIRNAHINQPIEAPEIRAAFSRWLGIGTARPDLVVRFGRAGPLPMSARRPVSEVLV